MAERPSVKDILAAARRGGPAKPEAEAPAPEAAPAEVPEPTPVEASEPVAAAGPRRRRTSRRPPSLGRPLTLEGEAGGRAGRRCPAPAARPPPKADRRAARPPPSRERAGRAAVAEAGPRGRSAAPPRSPAPAPSLGRPLTLKEKLAAARSGGASAAAAPAAAKPAAAKPAAADRGQGRGGARTLPPLEKMTDPKDLAEALRQTGAKKAKEAAAAAAARTAEEEGATPARRRRGQGRHPREGRQAADDPAQAVEGRRRRRRRRPIAGRSCSSPGSWSAGPSSPRASPRSRR